MKGRGGTVTVREAQQGHREYKTAQDARLALNELKNSGWGDWVATGSGSRGQPTHKFVLFDSQSNTWNTVDVDSVDTLKTNVSDTDQVISW